MASAHLSADAEAGAGAPVGPICVTAGVVVLGVFRPGVGRPLFVHALSIKLIANAMRASTEPRMNLIVQRFALLRATALGMDAADQPISSHT
jgi:hypothetical protein